MGQRKDTNSCQLLQFLCELSNVSIEKSIDDISSQEDRVIQLSDAAEVDYDPKSQEYEEAFECYDVFI